MQQHLLYNTAIERRCGLVDEKEKGGKRTRCDELRTRFKGGDSNEEW